MAKWKGPFIVTKIPNRLQIEYLDGNVTRLTHISYAKRYNERCHYTEPVGRPHPPRVSRRRARARMARLRLVAGGGRRSIRKIVDCVKVIRERWPVRSGHVRVQVLGDRKNLPLELKAVVEAADQDGWIEGSVLVDLCVQRSEVRGSGCDAPNASDELPLRVANPPSSPTLPAVQVRQYSFRPFSKKNVSDIRREFVGPNIQNNRNSSVLPRQEPHVAQVRLLDVVRKVGRSERLKGKQIKETIVKDLHKNREKTMTSSCHSLQNSESDHPSYSVILDDRERENIEIGNMSPSENDRSTLTQLKSKEKVRKGRFKYPESLNYDVMADDDISNSDVINLDDNINKPVARKRYVRRERSFIPRTGFFKRMSNMCSKTWINFALILVIIASVIRREININSPKQLHTTGLSSARRQKCVDIDSHPTPLFHPRLLRAAMTVITGFWLKSSSHIPKLIFSDPRRGCYIVS